VVDLSGWQATVREERRRGAEQGRPRVKIVEIDEMWRVAYEQGRGPVDGPSRPVEEIAGDGLAELMGADRR